MSRWLWLCTLLFVSSTFAQGQLKFNAPWGPYAIGFKVVHLQDNSRSWSDGHDPLTGAPVVPIPARPVQALIWFPATAPGKPMIYSDYLALLASEHEDIHDPELIKRVVDAQIRNWAGADPLSEYRLIAAQPVRATTDAAPAQGSFPLVIYAPSDSNASFEDDVLCEYLASHGYVVIATSSRGAHLPYMTNEQMPNDMANTRAQAADISFLIGQATTFANVDANRVAVLGYSWGGMASTFAAANDQRIKLLVYLDGSVRYFPKLLALAPDIQPDLITVPLLFFADQADPLTPKQDAKPGSFIDRINDADVTTIWLRDMQHDDLTSDSMRFGNDQPHGPATPQQRNQSYNWIARYTLAFLDAHFKANTQAQAFLTTTPESNGVPAGAFVMMHRVSRGAAPSLQNFAQHLYQAGYEHSVTVYADYRRAHPHFQLGPDQLDPWIDALLNLHDFPQASGLAQLETFIAPRDSDAWMEQAHVSAVLGQPTQTLHAFEKALHLDPSNAYTRKQVERLSHAP